MRKILTKEIKEEIINFYKSKPMTIEDIAKEYDYCKPTISKILKDIPKYSKVKIFSPNLVEDYFENIDSELKAFGSCYNRWLYMYFISWWGGNFKHNFNQRR